ncbi:MAG TPA: hypothetical protein PK323_05305 [Bacteroidia bacterium]|nr:hypothetical protein [Bacteroidia bacterium]
MKFKYLAILSLFTSSLFTSCSTDVNVIADYKEIAVVYGLLDVSQPIQYVKINKAFLGKGDAFAMAQEPDSTNFNPADMSVILEKYNGSNLVSSTLLYDTIIQAPEGGNFSKKNNIIYATRELLDAEFIYKLKIENKKTGYKAAASTNLIKAILFPQGGTTFPLVGTDNKYSAKYNFEWTSQKNGKIYEATFRFHYKEFKLGNDTAYKYVDWVLNPIYTPTTDGGIIVKKSIAGEDFFAFLSSIKSTNFSDNTVKRIPYRGQLLVTAAGEDFQIYKDLNAPYSSNFQEKPVYSNVQHGLGLFNTRITSYGNPRPFNSQTLDEFVKGKYTDDMGFIKP